MCPNSLQYGLFPVPSPLSHSDLVQEPPNLLDSGDAPSLPARPSTVKAKTPPPATPVVSAAEMDEQARLLKEYEDKQAALLAAQEEDARRRAQLEAQQQREFEQRQLLQQEQERRAQEELIRQQQFQLSNQQAEERVHSLERDVLALRGQFDRDQLMLEQYDRVCYLPPPSLSLPAHVDRLLEG